MSNNKSIYDYAYESNPKCVTFYDVFKTLLIDEDCIICLESAADLQGFSNGGYRRKINVYTEKTIGKPYVNSIIVKDLDSVPYIDYLGLKVSPINNAIVDMLNNPSTDEQILYETFANYYCENNSSYDGLKIPPILTRKADEFKKEGARFYES